MNSTIISSHEVPVLDPTIVARVTGELLEGLTYEESMNILIGLEGKHNDSHKEAIWYEIQRKFPEKFITINQLITQETGKVDQVLGYLGDEIVEIFVFGKSYLPLDKGFQSKKAELQ